MVSDLIFSLRETEIKFGKKIIFQNLDLNIHKGDMIALVGNNGVGKSTLMKIINGEVDIDNGKIWILPNVKVSYFNQNFEDYDKNKIFELFEDLINDNNKHFLDIYCDKLNLNKNSNINSLSGGQIRKVYLT